MIRCKARSKSKTIDLGVVSIAIHDTATLGTSTSSALYTLSSYHGHTSSGKVEVALFYGKTPNAKDFLSGKEGSFLFYHVRRTEHMFARGAAHVGRTPLDKEVETLGSWKKVNSDGTVLAFEEEVEEDDDTLFLSYDDVLVPKKGKGSMWERLRNVFLRRVQHLDVAADLMSM